ncbi:MAG TPA: radical SAM family heme chaperone HemW [Anaerolineaceae bacterium]|nr:radical SAM family heme chaperone HemW [Anaerolineaceae bacterium]
MYIHFPFCQKRCGYCDFFTRADMQSAIPAYVDSLVKEIEQVGTSAEEKLPVQTVFFGGGTPSLLSPAQASNILVSVGKYFTLLPGAEISLEANPGTVNLEKLQGYQAAGINRISFGVQSFKDDELQFLERIHSSREAVDAFEMARAAGFTNINLDLIFGLPGQTVASWADSLEQAVKLDPEHLSLYALTIEEGTPLHRQVEAGKVIPLDDDISADMYQLAEEMLTSGGCNHYEVSNWAAKRDGKVQSCIHNLQYWLNLPYLGIGAGAHG